MYFYAKIIEFPIHIDAWNYRYWFPGYGEISNIVINFCTVSLEDPLGDHTKVIPGRSYISPGLKATAFMYIICAKKPE